MRWFTAVSIVLVLVIGLSGCPPTRDAITPPADVRSAKHDWLDHHVGKVKSVGGFGGYLIVLFEDGVCYKFPYNMILDGDPWSIGDLVAIQDNIDSRD